MRQKIRRIFILLSLLLFPVTMNYLSPYVSVDGAFRGLVTGSVLVFLFLFFTGLFFSRIWCSWVCPIAGLSEVCQGINNRPVPRRKLRVVRYVVFAVWFTVLLAGFVLAGGIRGIDPFHLSEHVISVDEPMKFITYYLVLLIFVGLTVGIGRRGACHAICWMSPFLTAGTWLGKKCHLPQLRIRTDHKRCINCQKCNQKCPMSIAVQKEVQRGEIQSLDCIQCGECVDVCPEKVLRFGRGQKPKKQD